jgi:hypothetical protein
MLKTNGEHIQINEKLVDNLYTNGQKTQIIPYQKISHMISKYMVKY